MENLPIYFKLGFNKDVITYEEYNTLFSDEEKAICNRYWNCVNNSIMPKIIIDIWNKDFDNPQFKTFEEYADELLINLCPTKYGLYYYGNHLISENTLNDFFQEKCKDQELDYAEIHDNYLPCLLDILINVIVNKKIENHEETNNEFYLDQLYHHRTNLFGLYEIEFKRPMKDTIIDILYNRDNDYAKRFPIWISEWLINIANEWFDEEEFMTRYTLDFVSPKEYLNNIKNK